MRPNNARPKLARSEKYYVYIVECVDGTYYTGYTNDLEKRLKEHNNSKRGAKYLRGKTPVKLVYIKEYKSKSFAMRAEASIKKLTKDRKRELIKMLAPTDFSLKFET